MTRLTPLRSLATTALAAALLALAAGPAAAQVFPNFPGFDFEATGEYIDRDNDGIISCGDDVEFRARIGTAEGAPAPVEDGEFGAVMLPNGILVVGSVVAVNHHPAGGPVVVTEGNSSGDIDVRVDLGLVCPPGHCGENPADIFGATVTFFVRIRNPNFAQFLTVPGFARGSNYAQRSSQPGIAYEPCEPPTGPGDVDLFVVKDDGGVTAPAGSVVAYDVVYGNEGTRGSTGAVLTDTVPSHAVFDAAGSTTGWSCADGAPAGTVCTLPVGNLPPSSASSATFAVRIASTLPAGVDQATNTVTIADDGENGPDENPADNTSTDATPIAAAPDLAVAKDDGGVSTSPGAVVAYDLHFGNLGTQDATGVVLRDTVPDNATFEVAASSPGWSCGDGAPAGTICARAIGPLAVGETGAATFAVRVASALPPGAGQINNTATIVDDGANGADLDPANNSSTDSTPIVGAAPDLFVVKDDGGATTEAGGTVVYALTFGNAGSRGATRVELTDAVPDFAVFVAAGSSPRWSCSDGDPAGTICEVEIDSLLPGESDSLPFAVRVAPTLPAGVDQLVNTAAIADDGTNGPDLDPTNNASTDTTPIDAAPDLAIVKDDGGVTGAAGSTVVYTLAYTNAGTQGATGVEISDAVPAHAVFDAAASSLGWSCADGAPSGTLCELSAGEVAAGLSGSVGFAVRIAATLPAGVDELANTAAIADDGTNGADLDPTDNASTDTTPIDAAPDLSIVKDDGGVTAGPGSTVVYSLAYTNSGTQGGTGVVLADTVPEHTVFDAGASVPGWSCFDGAPAGTDCGLLVGALGAGEGASAAFAVRVVSPVPKGVDEIVNTATIADDGANGADPNPTDNTSTDTTPVGGEAAPDLFIHKDDGGVVVEPGALLVYDLAFGNRGGQGASGVEISDGVPRNTVFDAGASSPGWSCSDGAPAGTPCTLPLGVLGAGDAGGRVFAVRVLEVLPPGVDELTNTATITDDGANGPDLNPADNTSTDTTPVGAPVPGPNALDAFKTDDAERLPAQPGDAITYTVVVVNETDGTAAGTVFESGAPAHTALIVGTVSTTRGTVLEGNAPGDEAVAVDLGDLAAGEEAVVTFQVLIDPELPPEVTEIVCQGSVTAEGQEPILTDDPDTFEVDDPTRTPVAQAGGPTPVDIPTTGPFALALLVALLAGLAIRRLAVPSA